MNSAILAHYSGKQRAPDMQGKVYNNPLFASGLARLVESYMPNAEKQARLEESAIRMGLNRQRMEMNQKEMDGLGAKVAAAGRKGPKQFDPDIQAIAEEAIASGADMGQIEKRAKLIQSLRDRGIQAGF